MEHSRIIFIIFTEAWIGSRQNQYQLPCSLFIKLNNKMKRNVFFFTERRSLHFDFASTSWWSSIRWVHWIFSISILELLAITDLSSLRNILARIPVFRSEVNSHYWPSQRIFYIVNWHFHCNFLRLCSRILFLIVRFCFDLKMNNFYRWTYRREVESNTKCADNIVIGHITAQRTKHIFASQCWCIGHV